MNATLVVEIGRNFWLNIGKTIFGGFLAVVSLVIFSLWFTSAKPEPKTLVIWTSATSKIMPYEEFRLEGMWVRVEMEQFKKFADGKPFSVVMSSIWTKTPAQEPPNSHWNIYYAYSADGIQVMAYQPVPFIPNIGYGSATYFNSVEKTFTAVPTGTTYWFPFFAFVVALVSAFFLFIAGANIDA